MKFWERAYAPKNDAKFISNSHDYILMYARNILNFTIGRLGRTEEANARYSNSDNDPRGVWKPSDLSVKTYTAENDYPITTPSGRVVEPPAGRCWRLSKKVFFERLQDNRIWFGADGNSVPSIKRFLSEVKEGMTPTSILFYKEVGHSQEGAKEVTELLDAGVFDGPKPVRLMRRLLTLANLGRDSIVLDFFAGSASIAHAIIEMNDETGKRCSFIVVQLPETTSPNGTAFKAGYKTVSEISKERIRRAIKQTEETEAGKLDGFEQTPSDLGFRAFKLVPSNYRQWQPTEDTGEIMQQLELMAQSLLVEGWKPENVIFEVAIKEGYSLNITIDLLENISPSVVYRVTDPDKDQAFYICLDEAVPEDLLIQFGLNSENLFICLDSALNDTIAANFALQARLKTL